MAESSKMKDMPVNKLIFCPVSCTPEGLFYRLSGVSVILSGSLKQCQISDIPVFLNLYTPAFPGHCVCVQRHIPVPGNCR